jgi:CheY-like chemotaxis protein
MSAAVAKEVSGNADTFRRPDGQKRRVLYAEDQASARIVTTALLERMGFEVEAVEDGELAFECAMQASYDVILLDIEMPIMDGVTAARNIRAKADHCKATPILALSAFLADSTEHSVWRDAFDSALPKPANSNELQKAMRRALDLRPGGEVKIAPQWALLANNLPSGVLANLKASAAKEMNHLIVAYGACRDAGDMDTANHCLKVLESVAVSFEVRALRQILDDCKQGAVMPATTLLLGAAAKWQR